ncbi:hypothetical protein [Acetomicrobium mobile]|mgnify:CR=1 FL=1|uniref:hypothetical protein n=1 Tax=Acetomicrobium mobile TaxID=97477 RepID=UPI0026EECAD3|nr:hypothetical protein [Acetomicrobium mobile]
MADMYCGNCKRMVGTKKNLTGGIVCILIGLALLLFIPMIGLILGPVFGLIGIVLLIAGGKRCSVCGGKNISRVNPDAASDSSNSNSNSSP